tara:strand:- start:1096 stop:1245 length:150 start_codon:yes stop_codon:yes gene_type:complete
MQGQLPIAPEDVIIFTFARTIGRGSAENDDLPHFCRVVTLAFPPTNQRT